MESTDVLDDLPRKVEETRQTAELAALAELQKRIDAGKMRDADLVFSVAVLKGVPITWVEAPRPVRLCECKAAAKKGSRYCQECEDDYEARKIKREYDRMNRRWMDDNGVWRD